MCVLALAWKASRNWRLVAAGNRDELHARPSAALARWPDASGIIAGRDMLGGGTWLGVSAQQRFAVVTNVRQESGASADKASRGGLVTTALANGLAALAQDDLSRFNPFNLFVVDGDSLALLSNRPAPVTARLAPGVHGLSNGLHDAPWPKTLALEAALGDWVVSGASDLAPLFTALADERRFDGGESGDFEPLGSPVFIRQPVYGTRSSTIVTIDHAGHGMIAERRFGSQGAMTGETRLAFDWG